VTKDDVLLVTALLYILQEFSYISGSIKLQPRPIYCRIIVVRHFNNMLQFVLSHFY